MLNLTKRTKNLLKCGAVVVLLGAGARIYAELNGPKQHSLVIKLTKDLSPRGMSAGGKSLDLALKVVGRPEVSERALEGPRCKWTLESFQHRASAKEEWRDYSSANAGYTLLHGNGEQGLLEFPTSLPGEWKARVHTEVEYWDGETKETWQGAVTQEYRNAFSSTDLTRIAAAQKEFFRLEAIRAAQPPKGSVVLVKGKKYIGKMQYTENGEEHWQDVPLPNSPHYPITVDQDSVLGFRAVKANPQEKWPNYPDLMPQWGQNMPPHEHFGESVYLQFSLNQASDIAQTVTVRCGNQLSTMVHVLPSGNGDLLFTSDKKDLAVGASSGFSQTHLTLRSDHREAAYKNAKVRLSALYADGSKADVINGPGTQDDTVTLDKDRFAYATLRAGRKVGVLQVSAMLVAPDGKNLSNGQQGIEVNVHATWWAREQAVAE